MRNMLMKQYQPTLMRFVFSEQISVSTLDAFCANNAYDAVIANEAVPTSH
jgi:hypothetical protein